MKNFIKTLFAVLFGNAIFFGVIFLIFIIAIISIGNSVESKKVTVKNDSILLVNIKNGLSEMSRKEDPFNFDDKDHKEISIHQIIESIKTAKNDSKIASLLVTLNYNTELSYAQIDLLRDAIKDFKTSKKPVFAYGEVSSQKMYYLSTVADSIYVNPQGGLDIRGFGAQLTFYKNTIDKLEIEPQVFYAGKFKSATEPIRLTQMSAENKEQTRVFLSDFAEVVLKNIAQDRKISVEQLNESINSMKSMSPQDAKNAHLIDQTKYQDEVESIIKSKIDLDKKEELPLINVSEYYNEVSESSTGDIAVYIAEGNIVDGKSIEGNIGSSTVVKDMRKLAEDNDVKAVVLRISSPGGSALASAVMLREIELLQTKKPVVVSMGNYAASGGYYIASSANYIFAEPNTITGSIGVFSIFPNLGNMLKNKLGFTFDEIELNEHAVMNIDKALDPAESQKMQFEVDRIYQEFKTVVSRGRKMSLENVEQVAQGRVWSGRRAIENKLVDKLGNLNDAIAYATKLVKSDADDYFIFNQKPSFLEEFKENFSPSAMMQWISTQIVEAQLGDQYKYFKLIKDFKETQGVQAKMPFEITIR